jgi:hypothetical protein
MDALNEENSPEIHGGQMGYRESESLRGTAWNALSLGRDKQDKAEWWADWWLGNPEMSHQTLR